MTQITAPDGSLVTYTYDAQGNLVSARNLASGESHRYGYSSSPTPSLPPSLTPSLTPSLLTLVTGTPGTAGSAITYSTTTPQVSPVLADLGSAAQFTGKTTSDSLAAGERSRYTFSIRDSELRSTVTGTVLLAVEVQGALPILQGLTPVATHSDANGSYALFAVNRAGLNLIEVTSLTPSLPPSLTLFVAGDINRDGRVDGVDSGLLEGAIASGVYNTTYDFNRDGVINATDVQIIGSNYGFRANRAPVVTSTSVLTHTDLDTSIAIDKLATDPEGDPIFYRLVNPVNGTVAFSPDGRSARFLPIAGYSGTASFELIADDGFSTSAPATVTVNVSDAPLVNLDFAKRGLRLNALESAELVVIGDFADQENVVLPYSYLQFASDNSAVAVVTSTGKVTPLSDGVSVLSAGRNGITAVTTLRVGELLPTNQAQLNVAIAEQEGLDLYPEAVMLTQGVTRQLLVGLYGLEESPDLKYKDAGTRYYVSNPGILQIGDDGLITALNEGLTNVTVIYGAAEAIVPVRVEKPHLGETTLGINGGIIQFGDGANRSLLMLPQGALTEDTKVDFTLLDQKEDLSLPLPGGFEFAGGFNLNIGDNTLLIPAQIAIPAPADLPVGSEVYFMRKGSMPDATGTWQPMWMLEESGVVTADGMIRTQSPPFPGVTKPGEYAAFYSGVTGSGSLVKGKVTLEYKFPPAFYGLLIPPPPDIDLGKIGFGIALATFPNSKNQILKQLGSVLQILKAPLETVEKITNILEKAKTLAEVGAALSQGQLDAEVLKKVTELLKPYSAFGQLLNPDLFVSIPAFKVSYDISKVDIVQVPTIGLPVVTSANVQLNPDGVATFETRLNLPAPTTTDPSAPPVLQKAELKIETTEDDTKEPVLVLTGSNFIVPYTIANNSSTGFEDLIVNFRVGDQTYQGTILSGKDLGNNQFEVRVKSSNKIALASAEISITRAQKEYFGTEASNFQIVKYDSNLIRLSANNGYVLAAQPWSDKVAVLQGTNPEAVVEATSSNDLLIARIPVGTDDVIDRPRDIAFTKDGSRAYVTLENSGRIALVDPLFLQQIDTKPETEEIDTIKLPTAASARAIVVDNQDQYAYIADGRVGVIYVLDINPNSKTYHQVIQNIQIYGAPLGLRELVVSTDGRKLFATAPASGTAKSKIVVVNIDPKDKPEYYQNNLRLWHEQVAAIDVEGAEGLSTTADPRFLTFTNRKSDATGYGVIEITNDEPSIFFAATTRYAKLNLGSIYDYFDVNEGVSVVVTKDKKYGFVAGYNGSNFGSGIESIDGVQAGSNIGIIKDPLSDNPQLFAATRPIPLGLTTDLALSNDDKYLYASYPLGGGIYIFDVEEMVKTLERPTDYIIDQFGRPIDSPFFDSRYQRPANILDFDWVPIDDINPKISIAADYGIIKENRVRNQFTYGVFEGSDRAPVNVGVTRNLAVSPPDVLKLTSPNGIKEGDLTPTFTWDFQISNEQVQEVNLFVSTFAEGKGLLPWDEVVDLSDPLFLSELNQYQKQQLLTKSWNEYKDFNRGRIVTATWKRETNTWYWHDGITVVTQPEADPENTSTRFTLPDIRTLTAGQNYHWAVQAISTSGQSEIEFGQFDTIAPVSTNPFSSVTVLTHGFTLFPTNTGIPDNFYDLADSIASVNGDSPNEKGLILRYDKPTSLWIPVDKQSRVLTDLTGGLNPGDENYLVTLANNIQSKYVNQNKSLVLLPEWSTNGESIQSNSGFTEAAADAIFASIVQLDQALGGNVGEHDNTGNLVRLYDDKGDLISQQGALFNSNLHFIGFSRGTVVNSEIIQRLGTYFPYAGGRINADGTPVVDSNGKPVRDLQMTTIDPHDFYQESLKVDLVIPGSPIIKDFRDFNEPQVQVWDNVTFADNYYQTVADPKGSTWTPNGRFIDGADVNMLLNGRTGFTEDDRRGSPHGNVFSWYAGTTDLAIDEVDNGYTRKARPIYDQLGERSLEQLLDPQANNVLLTPWYYSSENQGSTEGIATGWFYSVLGGGKDQRPTMDVSKRVTVSTDNTSKAKMRGDYAVPTVFNGNFDAIFSRMTDQPIPGWSLNNGANYTSLQSGLKKWSEIGLGNSDNFALQLGANESITHNSFVVPDWGVLRFDLHVPVPDPATDSQGNILPQSSVVRVFLDDYELRSSAYQGLSQKERQSNGNPNVSADEYPAVDLREFNPNSATSAGFNPKLAEAQSNRIGFAKQGFQTFQVDIPNEFRGKVKTLKFEVNGGKTVYLDNVFFKSQHLLFGNPALNGQEARKDIDTPEFSDPYFIRNDQEPSSTFRTNYLIEKPQYSLSYNDDTRTLNWVSYQLNKSWLGAETKRPDFQSDPRLPFGTQKGPASQDINSANSKYDKGHMTAAADRSRNKQDYYSTFLMTNVLPQPLEQATGKSQWTKLEEYLRDKLVNKHDKELYIVEGRDGQAIDASGNPLLLNNKISVPESVWKVVLVLDHPGQGIYDVTKDTLAFGIYLPNILDANRKGQDPDDHWEQNFTLNGKTFGLFNVRQLENITGYNFLSNIPTDIQQAIENRSVTNIRTKISIIEPAPLMAATEPELFPFTVGTFFNSAVGHSSIPNQVEMSLDEHTDSPLKVSINQNSIFKIPYGSTDENSATRIHLAQIGSSQISPTQSSPTQVGREQISISQNRFYQTSPTQINTEQIGSSQISPTQIDFFKISSPQANTPQVSTFKSSNLTINPISFTHFTNNANQLNPIKVTLPSFVTLQQFISSNSPNHNLTSNLFSDLKYSSTNLWSTLFDPTFNINFSFTDLPTGQLAEAQITNYDSLGRPNGGTILIDHNANGIGWFIDRTPWENGEFTSSLTDTAFRATTGDAVGKYDLLTTILHEMGHLAGIIAGNPSFDRYVQSINGTKTFIGDNFTATLTPDGSHLDSKVHPYDLMNNTLAPGVRKLPSWLNLQMVNAIRSLEGGSGTGGQWGNTLQAPLTAILLADITNGNFNQEIPTAPDFGWSTRGAATILNSQAVLTEESRFNSNFTQTFIIPQEAKYLQFTIVDSHLGTSSLAPGDAFEVALLDARSHTPLVGTATGLTQTDSLFNLQHSGNSYFSDKVKIAGANTSGDKIALNTPRTVTVDISSVAPGTVATLYFDLLGFGAKDGKVIIDDIRILNNNLIAPFANNDTATTDQAQPVTINVLSNDSDADGTLNPNSVLIGTAPTNGSIIINNDGTITYTPNGSFVGIDTFTYVTLDNDNAISNEATITVTVNNTDPTIDHLAVESNVTEGTTATFSAIASDYGDTLTYTWNFGDGTEIITGQTVNHVFANNGTYTAILTVTDTYGAAIVETLPINVNNVAPNVIAGADQIVLEGQTVSFNGSFTDPGIVDTHTISWDFGDGTTAQGTLTPNHIFVNNGVYSVKLTVKDNDGGETSDTLTITVNNVAPTITNVTGNININEGENANFTATATDPGNDTLTYTWDFGDGTNPQQGNTVSHIFADNGIYTVTVTVEDTDGAKNEQTLTVNVNNVAPIVEAGVDLTTDEGTATTFNGNFTDPGILDTHTIEWDFGDGTTLEYNPRSLTPSLPHSSYLNPTHIYTANGTYNVTLTVRDRDGGVTADTLTVTVNNVAPIITEIFGDTNVDEGSQAYFSANATDPGNDTLTYTWNFGDGTDPVVGQNVSYIFADNGTYTVTLTVRDSDGASTSSTLSVNVNNVAPTVEAGDNQIMYVGETVAFDGYFTDPGILDTHTIVWDFGDGTTLEYNPHSLPPSLSPSSYLNPTHIYTSNGTYNVTLTVTDDDGGVTNDTITLTVKKPPTLSVNDISFIEGDDGQTYAVFTASLSEPSLRTVTANFSTTDGTATAESDYLGTSGTITFAPGETTQIITVAIIGDRTDEFDETFFLNFSNATNAIIADATGVGTILDNDEPPTLTITDKSIVEGDNGTSYAIFTVNLDALSAKPISVNFVTVDGTATAGIDYLATNGVLTFTPGETTKTITVELVGDTLDEYDETFFLQLSNATNATIVNELATGIILDNDEPPVLTIREKTITTTESGTAKVTFTVSLSNQSAKAITVDYSTVNGTAIAGKDYIPTSGTLTFAPEETTKTISIQLQDDSIDEYDETFLLKLNNAVHATIAEDAVGVVTIADNDESPALSIADKTITEGHDGISYMNFTVSLNAQSEKTISVKYATADGTAIAGSDYLANSGTLTFAPGETTKTISVAIMGDRRDELNESFSINLGEAINATIADTTAVGTIVDDDESPVLKVSASPAELWPPNHKMVEVKVNVQASDDFDPNPVVKLVSITSNEPDNGLGDGDTAGDIEIRPDGRIFLRAERSGKGNGRIYTLTYSATDSAGNVTYSTTQVRVPHSKGK
ncbi:PKD domain-containing protein [Chlorogloeopsis sp. ULAP01]|nr:PKD domain-containing protein [Chlorogloeopsis sp. ULAP01]MDM9385690.1 PKD domain-containing protein [Chlorogloeopsis sp. ULAP01]